MSTTALPRTSLLLAPVAVGALVVAIAATLTGCAGIADRMHHEHQESFDSYASARQGWSGPSIPAWIPEDATAVRSVATDDWGDAVVRVTTASALPRSCVTASRRGLPFDSRDWTPRIGTPATVSRCGDWDVVPAQDGWLAWFHAPTPGAMPEG